MPPSPFDDELGQKILPFELMLPGQRGLVVSLQYGSEPAVEELTGFDRRRICDLTRPDAVHAIGAGSADCVILPGTLDRAGEIGGKALQERVLRQSCELARDGAIAAVLVENLLSSEGLPRELRHRRSSGRRTFGGYRAMLRDAGLLVEDAYAVIEEGGQLRTLISLERNASLKYFSRMGRMNLRAATDGRTWLRYALQKFNALRLLQKSFLLVCRK